MISEVEFMSTLTKDQQELVSLLRQITYELSPISQLEIELCALISVMLTKFHGFKFDMLLD